MTRIDGRRAEPAWVAPLPLTLAAPALLFEIFVLITAFGEAAPIPGPCSG